VGVVGCLSAALMLFADTAREGPRTLVAIGAVASLLVAGRVAFRLSGASGT
jgi:hypothetical protein